MAQVQDQSKVGITCDLLFVWRTIRDGVAAQTAQSHKKYWQHWTQYSKLCSTDPYPEDLNPCKKAVIITAFAVRVQTRAYGQGDKVQVQTVLNTLASISQTCQLVGKQSPIFKSMVEYILPVKRLVEGF